MPMFLRKSVPVEARKFETDNDDGACIDKLITWIGNIAWSDGTDLYIETRGHTLKVSVGDWIIRDSGDGFLACTDSLFQRLYESVDTVD